MEVKKGHCKHGTFILSEGCPQCIAERQVAEQSTGNPPPAIPSTAGDTTIIPPGTQTTETPSFETALVPGPGIDTDVERFYEQAVKLKYYAEARTITNAEEAKAATNDLAIISKLKKAMETKRKEYLAPLQDNVKSMNDLYKSLMEPVLGADYITRHKLLDFQTEQERIRREQEEINRKRQEAAEQEARLKGEATEPVELVDVAPEPKKRVSTDLGVAGQRANWKFEVVDFALLPDEYKLPDTAMLNAIAKKYHDQKQIPGVRFYNEPTIQVTTR